MANEHETRSTLRPKAKAPLEGTAARESPESSQALLHELQVHQLELEMQNEALRQAQDELEESRNRYVDLFESAPVAYAIIARDGQLTQANQLAGQLLALSPAQLREYSFDQFIAPCDRERWREQVSAVWTSRLGETRDHELLLRNADGTQFPAQLQCVAQDASHAGPTTRVPPCGSRSSISPSAPKPRRRSTAWPTSMR